MKRTVILMSIAYVRSEDVDRLSPLRHEHVIRLGRYQLSPR